VSATAHDSGRTGNGKGVVCRLKFQQSFSPSLYVRIPSECLLCDFDLEVQTEYGVLRKHLRSTG
jgi:hypothetical protein